MRIRSEADADVAINRWFDTALRAVDPTQAVKAHLKCDRGRLIVDEQMVHESGRVFAVAVGKAALAMAHGAIEVCGAAVSDGLILTKDGHLDGAVPAGFDVFEASHPIPDRRGVAATERLLDRLGELQPGDVALALISGGGSALMEAPLPGVSLEDVATTTDLMLRAGAPIQHLNAVRIPLSRVKGGGLRHAARQARFVTLILSDVLGNDTRVIASGPTVRGSFTGTGALELLDRYRIADKVPSAVVQALSEIPSARSHEIFADDLVAIVGDNAAAVEAFERAAADEGVRGQTVWVAKEGEARELAAEWVELLMEADPEVDLLLGGGEATVTVRDVGVGGRNTEFALAAAIELERRGCLDWIVASLATDGQDALTGVAGAIASVETLERARAAGIDPIAALDRNDSLAVFSAAGGCVEPGPTGTNVNDIYVGLRVRR